MRLITSLVVVLACSLLACSSDESAPRVSSETATVAATAEGSSTATPRAELACPLIRDACALALYLRDALTARDFEAVATALDYRTFECPGGSPSGAGGPFPLCDGAAAGTRRAGTGIARRYSEGAVVSREDYLRILRQFVDATDPGASDVFGSGSLTLYSLSCREPVTPPESCRNFAVIFSAILRPASIAPLGTVPGREILAFFAEAPAPGQVGNAAITETWMGIIQPGEGRIILQQGGTLFDLGRIFSYKSP